VEPDGLDELIERSRFALGEIIKGNPEPWEAVFSHQDDVTLGNPFGPFARGWKQVFEAASGAAARYRDGEIVAIDPVARYVTSELACVVEVERFRAKVGGSDDFAEIGLRVTSVFRPEDGTWKLVHRHADPITTPRPAESVVLSG
jgi:ketosteroid isomerase-like protein